MSGQWKPGDVAIVNWPINSDGPFAVIRGHGRWHFLDDPSYVDDQLLTDAWLDRLDATFRPLVVIDPEDAEAVERLVCALENLTGHANGLVAVHMADALREFANPTPPKPDEPQGLGAVVRDAEGKRWVGLGNTFAGGQRRWQSVEGLTFSTYRTIDAVEVLSEGVTP